MIEEGDKIHGPNGAFDSRLHNKHLVKLYLSCPVIFSVCDVTNDIITKIFDRETQCFMIFK